MGEDSAQTIANRDTPIPIVAVTSPDSSKPRTPVVPDESSHRLSASKLKGKLESLSTRSESPSRGSDRVSDKVFTMLLQQVLPEQDYQDETPTIKDRRSRAYVDRPAFSIPTMSSNFRRFNSRIGVAFVFENRLIRLFTWRQPTQTLSFLAVYTFICLDPALVAVAPLAGCLFFVMVPSFLARHPPPPTYLPTELYPLGGPPIAGARTIRPAPELSKDFFRNMRDLQNTMEDFSRAHDAVLAFLTPLTNFSNEALSSMIYILLLLLSCLLFISAHLLPWRYIFLVGGWAFTLLGHPTIQDLISSPTTQTAISEKEHESRSFLLTLSKSDIELVTSPETREVEIFELQHRALHDEHGEYESYIFSPRPYAPLSPSRIAGDRPKGAAFFEDVQPPRGWRWSDKKWTLDLASREWVEERCVTGVEVEIEGERWVTDLHYEMLEEDSPKGKKGKKSKDKDPEKVVLRRAWESHKPARKGEWRRRRWVRGVERVPITNPYDS
ncbi:Pex24p-domain-containing protein [Aaosphaeria arxii CBS 175.79]|uniref:Pex24p-domain-containing protein n=1 Tax=Aaosphaeria arxii CBS 175.79 TaxID=1450172 RepID=A0A6A5XQG9_9PLEO|nr:Pex24p-domain-containing protein [Aaosphaeria arxii CBS 175.79]KAF2014980.1 Pex24p-domain-containing protein [Aaosphaeria arxii CBS 175.79]